MDRDKVLELVREAELDRQLSMEVPFVVDRLERFVALIEREVRGDAEPTLYQRRMKPLFDYKFPWSAWEECSKEAFNQYKEKQTWGDWIYEVRKLYLHPAPAASAESVASVHIKDGCLIGSQRKSGVDIPDGQYALYPIGTYPTSAVDAEPVARLRFYKGEVVVTKDYETVERNGEFDVYTHPTPAVVRQLVDALSHMTDVFLDTVDSYGPDETDAIEIAEQALAAAKESGL